MRIDNVIVEITRMCNMNCRHCLRGEPQRKHLSHKHMIDLFSKIARISSLTFTGGEPSLNVAGLKQVLYLLYYYGIRVDNFYLATNGKYVTVPFLQFLIEMFCYCDDNENSMVELSNDVYHEKPPDENIKKLKALSFFKEKYNEIILDPLLIAEGRSKDFGDRRSEIEIFEIDKDMIYSSIYLNCKGNIISGCDWSYKSQDKPENIVCKVGELSIKKLKEYNERMKPYITGQNKTWVQSC